jgi:hypothetical protein
VREEPEYAGETGTERTQSQCTATGQRQAIVTLSQREAWIEPVRQRADYVGAYRVLTAAAAMAGEIEIAKAALQELRRLQPNISLQWITKNIPIKRNIEREHYLEGFRRAGLD